MQEPAQSASAIVGRMENMLAVIDLAERNAKAGSVGIIPGAAQAAREIVAGEWGWTPPISATLDACAYALMGADPAALDGFRLPEGEDWPDRVLAVTGRALVALVRGEPGAVEGAGAAHLGLRDRQASEELPYLEAAEPGLGQRRAAFRAGCSYFVSAALSNMAQGEQPKAAEQLRAASRWAESAGDIYLCNATRALALACATSPLLVRTAAPAPEEVEQAGAPTAPDAPVP